MAKKSKSACRRVVVKRKGRQLASFLSKDGASKSCRTGKKPKWSKAAKVKAAKWKKSASYKASIVNKKNTGENPSTRAKRCWREVGTSPAKASSAAFKAYGHCFVGR